MLAVDEAVANAIEHSVRHDAEPGFIDIVAMSDGRWIRVEVTDQGSWRPPHDDESRGRGLNIIGALMDRVQVATTNTGTRRDDAPQPRALRSDEMTKPGDRKHIPDVAPGVAEDLGFHDGADRVPTPDEERAADDLSPDQRVALNYEKALRRGRHVKRDG